jgi:hypothetical protein
MSCPSYSVCVCVSLHLRIGRSLVVHIRGLSLTCKALQHMQKDPNAPLYTCFQISYEQVLGQHHGWVVNSLAYVSHFSYDPILILTTIHFILHPARITFIVICYISFSFHRNRCSSILISRFPALMPAFLHLHGQTSQPR